MNHVHQFMKYSGLQTTGVKEWTGGWVDRQHWLQQSTWVKILSVNIDGVTTRLNCLCYTHIVCYFGTVCVMYISIVSARLEYLQIVSARLEYLQCISRGGWGCEVSFGGHHRQRGKTTIGSALDGAVLDFTQILAYLVHNMSRSQLYLGFSHFGWLLFSVSNILAGL